MKTLLTMFFKSLTCKLMWTMVATAAAANAHDLPSDCPLVDDDWGVLHQDCLGVRDNHVAPISLPFDALVIPSELMVYVPEAGEPPRPVKIAKLLAGSSPEFQYDRVDCSILESQFRGYPLVEATAARAPAAPQSTADTERMSSEFDQRYYGTCTCEFESHLSAEARRATQFVFKRECVADAVPLRIQDTRWRFMDQIGLTGSTADIVPIATVTPTVASPSQQLFGDMLSEFATWDCIVQAEFYDCQRAFQIGNGLARMTSGWYQVALPALARKLDRLQFASPPLAQVPSSAPMFVLYSLGGGKTLAIPVEQARHWKFAAADTHASGNASEASQTAASDSSVSPEFRELLKQGNSRLKWAGGRLSQAADYLNDWFSARLARSLSDDSIR